MNELIWQAQTGNKEAMSKIIDDNIGLVWNIVRRFSNRGYELDDLFQIGCIGFVKAIRRFNTDYETQLSTYAVPMIIGEIKRFLRDNGPIKVSRSLKELANKINQLQEENIKKYGNELSIKELEKELNISKEEIVEALDATSYIESLDRNAYDDNEMTIGERLVSDKNDYTKLLDKITVEGMINKLNDREKRIVIYRYFKDKTQNEIACLMGISQVQVSRIEKRALEKMRV